VKNLDDHIRDLERAAASNGDAGSRLNHAIKQQRMGVGIPEEELINFLLDPTTRDAIIAVIHQKNDVFLNFIVQVPEQADAAISLHDQYKWLRKDDEPRPTTQSIESMLVDYLRAHELHRRAIRTINNPRILLEPVIKDYKSWRGDNDYPYSAGFRRLVKALDDRSGQPFRTFIDPYLQNMWKIPELVKENEGGVDGWRVFITEGSHSLNQKNNPCTKQTYFNLRDEWRRTFGKGQKLHSPTKEQYAILNMFYLLRWHIGIDEGDRCMLEEPACDPLTSLGFWDENKVFFSFDFVDTESDRVSFRPTIIVPGVYRRGKWTGAV
jgi:hypothetical protein